jgi:hypothetical protein
MKPAGAPALRAVPPPPAAASEEPAIPKQRRATERGHGIPDAEAKPAPRAAAASAERRPAFDAFADLAPGDAGPIGPVLSLDQALSMERSDSSEPRVKAISDIPVPAGAPRTPGASGAVPAGPKKSLRERFPSAFDAEDAGGAPMPPTPPPPSNPVEQMRDRFDAGDYSGALAIAETLLASDPSHRTAQQYADNCREMLCRLYLSRLGDKSRIPRVVMAPTQLRWLTLDHRSGFLLSCVDGMSSIEEILDVSGMAQIDTLRILNDLLQQGVIEVEPRRRGRR